MGVGLDENYWPTKLRTGLVWQTLQTQAQAGWPRRGGRQLRAGRRSRGATANKSAWIQSDLVVPTWTMVLRNHGSFGTTTMDDVLHGDGQEFSDSKKDTMTSLNNNNNNTRHKPITYWHRHRQHHQHGDGHLQGRPEHRMSKERPCHR